MVLTRGGSHARRVTQGELSEVGLTRGGSHARWITRGTSHLVKCFTP